MSKPNDPSRDESPVTGGHSAHHPGASVRELAGRGAGVLLIAVVGLMLQAPVGASAGIASSSDDDKLALKTASSAPPAAARGAHGYQLRCWQYGRLLFDEGPVTLAQDARQGARLVATDRNGASIIVTDNGNTTCQTRPVAATPNLGMPR